ncbi:MAG: alpha/beta fold hydrolase [Chitinophagaceae bacterium]
MTLANFLQTFEGMNNWRKKTLKIAGWLALAYLLLGILFYWFQDLIFFHPKPLKKTHVYDFAQLFREVNIALDKRNLSVVQFTAGRQSRGIVLYFHGNMQNVERYAAFMHFFTDSGFEVWMMDYPGFGKSTGALSEKGLYDDAALLYSLAVKQVKESDIVIYGKSIGTGVATQLAAGKEIRHLFLETPYYSLPAIASSKFPIYPFSLMMKYTFPIHLHLPKVKAGVTIFHGTEDEIISYRHSRKLVQENPQVRLVRLPHGKHNNLTQFPAYEQTIRSILGEVQEGEQSRNQQN